MQSHSIHSHGPSLRRCEELPWHLRRVRRWTALKDTLSDLRTSLTGPVAILERVRQLRVGGLARVAAAADTALREKLLSAVPTLPPDRLRALLVAPGLDGAAISSRLTYDWANRRVRVQWYSRWRAKSGAVLGERPLHVDGVSFFDLNDDGKVYRHTIERVLINGVDAAPPFFGLIDARRWLALNGRLAGSPEPAIAAPVGAPNWSERR